MWTCKYSALDNYALNITFKCSIHKYEIIFMSLSNTYGTVTVSGTIVDWVRYKQELGVFHPITVRSASRRLVLTGW